MDLAPLKTFFFSKKRYFLQNCKNVNISELYCFEIHMHVGTNHLSFHYLTQVFDIISSSLLLPSSPKKEQHFQDIWNDMAD